jgi:hypothetical protein
MSDERHNPGREPGRDPRRERFEDLKEAYTLGALSEEELSVIHNEIMQGTVMVGGPSPERV